MSDQWYIKTKSGRRGPYNTDQLQRYVDAGAIRPKSGIGDDQGNWFAASTISGLVFSDADPSGTSNDQDPANSARAADDPTTSGAASAAAQLDLTQREAELQRRQDEIDQREAELRQRSEEIDQRSSELQRSADELEQHRGELEQLRGELEVREAELGERQSQLEQRGGELERLGEQLAERTTELDQQRGEFETESTRLAELQSAVEAQQQQLDAQQADQGEAERKFAETKKLFTEQTAELDQRAEQLDSREQVIAERESELEQQQTRLAEQETELHSLGEQLQSLQQEKDQLQQSFDRNQTQWTKIAGFNDELRHTNAQLESTLDKTTLELETVNAQLAELEAVKAESSSHSSTQQSSVGSDSAAPSAEGSPSAEASLDLAQMSVDQVLAHKRELLSEFAQRQESLAQREAELMRREAELTRRELDFAAMPTNVPDSTATDSPVVEDSTIVDAGDEQAESPQTVVDEGVKASSDDDELSAQSWEEVFESAETEPDSVAPFVDPDPRYSPIADQEPQLDPPQSDISQSGTSPAAALSPDDEVQMPDQEPADLAAEFQPEADLGDVRRLPSEMLPSELSQFDGVGTDAAGAVATRELTLMETRRKVYTERFGPCSDYHVDDDQTMRVDVSVHPPSESRDFTTLVTSGMSDYPIAMPNGQRSVRGELLLYVTHVDETAIKLIRGAAKIPYQRKHGLSIGTTSSLADLGGLLSGSSQQDCVYMLPVVESDSKPIAAQELVGGALQLFWLVTITEAERNLIDESGIHKFLALLEKNNHAVYFDLTRECYVKRKGWFRR